MKHVTITKFILASVLAFNVLSPATAQAGFFQDLFRKLQERFRHSQRHKNKSAAETRIDCNRVLIDPDVIGAETALVEAGHHVLMDGSDRSQYDYRIFGGAANTFQCLVDRTNENRRSGDATSISRYGICSYGIVVRLGIADEMHKRPGTPVVRYVMTQVGTNKYEKSIGAVTGEELDRYLTEIEVLKKSIATQIMNRVCQPLPAGSAPPPAASPPPADTADESVATPDQPPSDADPAPQSEQEPTQAE